MSFFIPRSPWNNRIHRAKTENMKIIQSTFTTDKKSIVLFAVTGRIYEITFDEKIKCSCPYHTCHSDELCKHILFVLIKLYDMHDLPSEKLTKQVIKFNMQEIIRNIQISLFQNPTLSADKIIQQKYLDIINTKHVDVENIRNNDNCMICFDVIDKNTENIACPTCKNLLHKQCIEQWFQHQHCCPYCRSDWHKSDNDNTEEIMNMKYLKIT